MNIDEAIKNKEKELEELIGKKREQNKKFDKSAKKELITIISKIEAWSANLSLDDHRCKHLYNIRLCSGAIDIKDKLLASLVRVFKNNGRDVETYRCFISDCFVRVSVNNGSVVIDISDTLKKRLVNVYDKNQTVQAINEFCQKNGVSVSSITFEFNKFKIGIDDIKRMIDTLKSQLTNAQGVYDIITGKETSELEGAFKKPKLPSVIYYAYDGEGYSEYDLNHPAEDQNVLANYDGTYTVREKWKNTEVYCSKGLAMMAWQSEQYKKFKARIDSLNESLKGI